MKKGWKILGTVLAALLLLILLSGLAVQMPIVQTLLGQAAIREFRDQVDADVTFQDIAVVPLEAIVLRNLTVVDRTPAPDAPSDTLLSAEALTARFSLRGLFRTRKSLYISRVHLEGGVFNLVMEDSTTNIQRIFRLNDTPKEEKEETGESGGFRLDVRQVEIQDFLFRMVNDPANHPGEKGVINWNDLELIANLKATGLKMADGIISGTVQEMDMREKSGAYFSEIRGKVRVGDERLQIENLHLHDRDSDLNLRQLALEGPLNGYSDFVNRIRIEADIRPSVLAIRTLGSFAASLSRIGFKADLRGRVSGTVNDLSMTGISFNDLPSGVSAGINGHLKNVTDLPRAIVDFDISQLSFTLSSIIKFIQGWAPGTQIQVPDILRGDKFTFDGFIYGLMDNFNVNGTFKTAFGSVTEDIHIADLVNPNADISIRAMVATENLDIGHITGSDAIRQLSLFTRARAVIDTSNPDFVDMGVRIDTLTISRLNALGYDYTGITASGDWDGENIRARVISRDPALGLMIRGETIAKPESGETQYKLNANISHADLEALGFDKRGRSVVSLRTQADVVSDGAETLRGLATVAGIALENDTGVHYLPEISLMANSKTGNHKLRLDSDFLEASFSGTESVLAMVSDLQALLLSQELPALQEAPDTTWHHAAYDFSAKLGNTQELFAFLSPKLYVEEGTSARMKVTPAGAMDATVSSRRIALDDKYIKDFRLNLDNGKDALNALLTGSTLKAGPLELTSGELVMRADSNAVSAAASYQNEEPDPSSARINLSALLSRGETGLTALARVLPSGIEYGDRQWDLHSQDIAYDGDKVSVDRLILENGPQQLCVSGGYALAENPDTLHVNLKRFDVGLLNRFLGEKFSVGGEATGDAMVTSPGTPMPGILANILCEGTTLSGLEAGTLLLASQWNEADERFDASILNTLEGQDRIDAVAWLKPSTSELSARVKLDSLNVAYAAPLLTSVFSDMQGHLCGTLLVDGKTDDLRLGSDNLHLKDGILEIDYTRVAYQAEGPVDITTEGVTFRDVAITDGEEGRGTISGGLTFGGFKDIRMDTHIRMRQMKVLNLAPGINPTLYGTLYGNGRVDVTGPFSDLLLNINARTAAKDGDLHIPLGGVSSSSSDNLLTFKEPEVDVPVDPYELMMSLRQKAEEGGSELNVLLHVSATPDVTAFIDIGDNSLKGNGRGEIDIHSRSSDGLFTIGGDYTLTGGNFHFSALNLVSRDFSLQDGSSIRFSGGDVMDSELDINGLYTTKASLANILADSTSVNRRTVNCGINITDKLRNPKIGLSIDVPDLDPGTEALLQSALNTEDKVQKQFLYLLLTGSFLPSEESGITTNNSGMLVSNVTSIMAGQLNNILQKLDIPVDLGLNYQSTDSGNDLFDVALSTQLFNNRVLVNGSIGNKRYGSATTDEVSGDLDIEIKLDKPGTFRLNLFSHSADQYTNLLDNSQRNGIGIAYQKSFNTTKQLFQDIFSSKSERGQRRQEEAVRRTPSLTLQIDSTGRAAYVETPEPSASRRPDGQR